MYVTLWYFLSALVWTFLTYAMGNFIPEYFVCGSSASAIAAVSSSVKMEARSWRM